MAKLLGVGVVALPGAGRVEAAVQGSRWRVEVAGVGVMGCVGQSDHATHAKGKI